MSRQYVPLLKHRLRVSEVCAHCGEPWPCVISKVRDEVAGMFRRAATNAIAGESGAHRDVAEPRRGVS